MPSELAAACSIACAVHSAGRFKKKKISASPTKSLASTDRVPQAGASPYRQDANIRVNTGARIVQSMNRLAKNRPSTTSTFWGPLSAPQLTHTCTMPKQASRVNSMFSWKKPSASW